MKTGRIKFQNNHKVTDPESRIEKLISECKFTSSRSQGPGGQNVNKVNSKVEIRFQVAESTILNESEKQRIFKKLKNRINNEKELVLSEQGSRSQIQNKRVLIERFKEIVQLALKRQKPRKPTKPRKASVQKRLEVKKHHAEKKNTRRKPDI